MKCTPQIPHATDPAHRRTPMCRAAVRSTAVRRVLWVLGPLATAVPVTAVLMFAGAGADWTAALWFAAVLWAIAASFMQALWQGLCQGDWSAFTCEEFPRDDENFDWETKSGQFAYLRIQAEHEALMRDGDWFLRDHDHANPL